MCVWRGWDGNCDQGILLILCLGITSRSSWRPYAVLGLNLGWPLAKQAPLTSIYCFFGPKKMILREVGTSDVCLQILCNCRRWEPPGWMGPTSQLWLMGSFRKQVPILCLVPLAFETGGAVHTWLTACDRWDIFLAICEGLHFHSLSCNADLVYFHLFNQQIWNYLPDLFLGASDELLRETIKNYFIPGS